MAGAIARRGELRGASTVFEAKIAAAAPKKLAALHFLQAFGLF
ncbi:hypothetical protein [Mesorhizobium sp.]|nr:hypothetical protein [Mesorhizobium sp.]